MANLTYLASPYRATTPARRKLLDEYVRDALRDSIFRGETPVAPHMLYTEVLDDTIENQRKRGIKLGNILMEDCAAMVFYLDHGLSYGMEMELMRFLASHAKWSVGMGVYFRFIREDGNRRVATVSRYDSLLALKVRGSYEQAFVRACSNGEWTAYVDATRGERFTGSYCDAVYWAARRAAGL